MYQKQTKGLSILLLLISPILGLFFGVKNLTWKNRKLIILLFSCIYGSLITYEDGADAGRYIDMVDRYNLMSFSDFIDHIFSILNLELVYGYPTDLYVHFLAYFVGSLIGFSALFYPIVGFIYGYFYAGALEKVLKFQKKRQITIFLIFTVALFVIHRSFENMQTVRSWTGMWVLFNGVLGYFQTKNKKYLFLIAITPFFHFAYLILALPSIAALFANRVNVKVIVVVYLLSFFGTIGGDQVINLSKQNELAERKVKSYYREDKYGNEIDVIEERIDSSESVWYAKYGKTDSVYWGGNAFSLFLIAFGFYRKRMTIAESGVFTAGILTAVLANLGSFAYGFYSRTMACAVTFMLATVVMIAIRDGFRDKELKNYRNVQFFKWFCVILFIPKIIYFIANFLVMTSAFNLIFPFMCWFNPDLNFSIREFLGVFI